jgi:hypothetical protein
VPRCPAELLDDLADVFAEIRTWAGVVEKEPGVFSVRREPFLHFHVVDGGRRGADVEGGTDWVQLFLPHPIAATRRRALLRRLRASWAEKR